MLAAGSLFTDAAVEWMQKGEHGVLEREADDDKIRECMNDKK